MSALQAEPAVTTLSLHERKYILYLNFCFIGARLLGPWLSATSGGSCLPSGTAAGIIAGALLLLIGLAMLRLSWADRNIRSRAPVVTGWAAIAVGVAIYGHALGEVGIAAAFVASSALAYAVITAGGQFRAARLRPERERALEPEERPTNWLRGAAKSFLAIVLAGIAAIGIGVAFAVAMPLSPPDRIVIGGILVPILWGGGMAWTLSDAKLVRATLLLVIISAGAYAIAFLLKGAAS